MNSMRRITRLLRRKLVLVVVLCTVCAGAGFAVGWIAKPPVVVSAQAVREHTAAYRFIHPLLLVARPDIAVPSPQYAALAKKVSAYIAERKKAGVVQDVSLMFIHYGKGGSFAIKPGEAYAPASLLKVVIMVAYLKQSDVDPSALSRKLVYDPGIAQHLEYVPLEAPSALEAGHSYSVSDLIDRMIADSDNGAMQVLLTNISDAYLGAVYRELGLKGPEAGERYAISAQNYSVFFRILYNATYLSETSSEKALSILSRATFAEGLAAGLPSGTVLAHKFGEHVDLESGSVRSVELHDCGIVYPDGGPYLLCVMTRGTNLDSLKETIAGISAMVFAEATK